MSVARADAGIPRLTRRDVAAIEWLEDMRVVYETDLAVLLGRLSGRAGAVSPSAARNAIQRWRKLSLVNASKLFAGEPRMVWLTETGASVAGAGRWREPGVGVLRHTALCARVRLWLEQRGLAGQAVTGWVSERRWRQQHPDAIRHGAHVPDGLAVTEDGQTYAIEVEVSDKGPGRAMEIALRLTQSYARVVYIVEAETQTARTVRGALEQAVTTMRNATGDGQVDVLELPGSGGEQG